MSGNNITVKEFTQSHAIDVTDMDKVTFDAIKEKGTGIDDGGFGQFENIFTHCKSVDGRLYLIIAEHNNKYVFTDNYDGKYLLSPEEVLGLFPEKSSEVNATILSSKAGAYLLELNELRALQTLAESIETLSQSDVGKFHLEQALRELRGEEV